MRSLPLLVPAVCLLVLGCSDSMSPSDYRQAWRQAVTDYRAIPKDPSLVASSMNTNGANDNNTLSQAAQSISEQMRAIGKRIYDLKAPSQYEVLQQDTYLFYRGQADDYLGYANAFGDGDQTKIGNAADEINSFAADEQHKIDGDITDLGRDADLFRDAWADVLKDPNAAPPVAPVAPPQTAKPAKPKHHHKK